MRTQAHGDRANEVLVRRWPKPGARLFYRARGGLSMREARRAGSVHELEEGKSRSRSPRRTRLIADSAAVLPCEPNDGELGSPESPQGAELMQAAESAAPWSRDAGSELAGRTGVSTGPQQHDDPRHFVRHLQYCEWSSTTNPLLRDIDDPNAAPPWTRTHASIAVTMTPGRYSTQFLSRLAGFTPERLRCRWVNH